MNIDKCRVCESNNLTDVIDLGNQPWCNDFIFEEELGKERKYPLVCCFCGECSTLQVRYTVPKEIMYSDHTYLSGSTKTMPKLFQSISDYVCTDLIDSKGLVVDIGSNDGTLLNTYKRNGMDVLGVEPNQKIAKIANENAIPTDASFFDYDYAKNLVTNKGKALVISAANVFYHVEDLHSIVKGISYLLDKNGVFVIQASYLPNLIRDKAFDIMYHEHLLYYRIENLNFLLNLYNLEIFQVKEAEVHGGSIIVYACHKNERKIDPVVNHMIEDERKLGFDSIDIYINFNQQIKKLKSDLLNLLKDLKSKGSKIYAYGAPAKGTVMLNYCELNSDTIDLAVEVNPLKIGRFIPCTGISIQDEQRVDEPDYYLLLSWNFYKEFMKSDIFLSGNRKFILPLPHPKILTKD